MTDAAIHRTRAEGLRRASVLLSEALWSLPVHCKDGVWYSRMMLVYGIVENARGKLAQLREDIEEDK